MTRIKMALVVTSVDDDGETTGRTGLVGEVEIEQQPWEDNRRSAIDLAVKRFLQDVPDVLPAQLDKLAAGEIVDFGA